MWLVNFLQFKVYYTYCVLFKIETFRHLDQSRIFHFNVFDDFFQFLFMIETDRNENDKN